MACKKYKKSGWHGESMRHSLARKGIKTKKVDYGFIDQYKGRGVFDPFYDNPVDTDGDHVPDVYDLHPLDSRKHRHDWAKKDWKRSKRDNNTWHWIDSKTLETKYIQVYTTAGFHNVSKNIHLEGWIVEIHGSDIKPIVRQFKDKKEAIKFANEYMKDN